MTISFDFAFIPEEEFCIQPNDRAFSYGDGLFETLVMRDKKIRFFKDHFARLTKGMKALGMKGIKGLRPDVLKQQLHSLVERNGISGNARLKIQIWRKPGGLYTPQDLYFHILMTAKDFEPPVSELVHLGVAQTAQISPGPLSRYKTCNALPYIVAGIELQKSTFNDLVLLNHKQQIAECTASNIFWVRKGTVFTPSLSSGCIAGIMRKNVIKQLQSAGINVVKTKAEIEVLLQAEHIFLTNVARIAHVGQFKQQVYAPFQGFKKLKSIAVAL